jgi:UDP-glucuronate 4-epimerase
MKKERIFVTGNLGFIGYHASCKLKEMGALVLGVDNCNDYYDRKWKFLRLKNLQENKIACQAVDIADQASLKKAIEAFKPTKILHLAAQAGVRYSQENPKAYIRSNIEGSFNIFEIAKQTSTPVVYASSSSVYGQNQKIPFEESDPTDLPMSLYAMTKKSNELMAQTYHFLHQLPIIGLRFFTVYGPYGRPDMAYFSFAEKIMRKEPITVYDHGFLKRDFTYIDDIVDGIISALDFPVQSGVFNLGNHQPHSVNELVAYLEKYLAIKAIIHYQKAPKVDVQTTYASIEKSQKILNFSPKISLEEGIKRFSSWYLKNHAFHLDLELEKKKHPEYFLSNL